jgi:hypothetical protein
MGTLALMLVLSGYGLGLFLAAQVGPVTLLIVRSVLRGGRALVVGLAMAAAVAAIDLIYAVVGLAGVGRLLNGGSVRLWLGLVSAAVLVAIGARTLWIGWRARVGLEFARPTPRSRATACAVDCVARAGAAAGNDTVQRAIVSGFSAVAATAVRNAREGATTSSATLSWYGGFSTAVALIRNRVGDRLLRFVDITTGSGLIAFGGLLGYRTLHEQT